MHSVKSEQFFIKLFRKLNKFYPIMTIISSDHENEIQFSEIIYHVLGYKKWFAQINDSTPLNCELFKSIFQQSNAHWSM